MRFDTSKFWTALPLVSAVVVAVQSNSAWALATASLSMSDVKIELIDLDISDGVSPSIAFLTSPGNQTSSHAHLMERIGNDRDYFNDSRTVAGFPGTPVTVSVTRPTAYSSASLSGADLQTGMSFAADVSVNAPIPSNLGQSLTILAEARAGHWSGASFTLSANTGLRLTGLANMSATADSEDYSKARILLGFWGYSGEYWDDVFVAQVEAGTWPGRPFAPLPTGAGDFQQAFSLQLDNTDDNSTNVNLDLSAYVYGTSPVPEPAVSLMLLGGLALIGAAARRKA